MVLLGPPGELTQPAIVEGHPQLPDLRLEYETQGGRHEVRDVEVVTERYSRSQLADNAQASFTLYRPVGSGVGRSSGPRSAETPVDPRTLVGPQ